MSATSPRRPGPRRGPPQCIRDELHLRDGQGAPRVAGGARRDAPDAGRRRGARRARALPRASGRVVAAPRRETVGAAGGSGGRADDPRERLPPLRVRGPADGDDGWRRLRYRLRTPSPRSCNNSKSTKTRFLAIANRAAPSSASGQEAARPTLATLQRRRRATSQTARQLSSARAEERPQGQPPHQP